MRFRLFYFTLCAVSCIVLASTEKGKSEPQNRKLLHENIHRASLPETLKGGIHKYQLHSRFRQIFIPRLTQEELPQNAWHSQVQQDALVAYLLNCKRGGFFVDLAANDAVEISNTFSLEQLLGWKGICWEANSHYWYRLATKRTCHLMGGAAAGKSGEEIDFAFAGGRGGIYSTSEYPTDVRSEVLASVYERHKGQSSVLFQPEEKVKVSTATLNEVLDLFAPFNIDYLSLDVEGAEWLVLEKFNFHRHRFAVMTIERPGEQLQQLLQSHGYKRHPENIGTFGETLWMDGAFPSLENILSTPMKTLVEEATKTSPLECFNQEH